MTSDPRGNLWPASCAETIDAPPLSRDLRVDLAVIGGGFTGCAAALEGARRGASVCLLEAGEIGFGGSGRNVGLVNAGLWLPPDQIVAEIGETEGDRLISILAEGPQRVFSLIEEYAIQCEATRNGTLHCAHAHSGYRDLEDRFRQGVAHGAPLQLLDAEETRQRTGATGLHGAILDPRAGTVQPLSYCRGLARAARQAGAHIAQDTPATDIARENGQWVVRTARATVRARALVMATNAYHFGLERLYRPEFVTVSYSQFATAPMPDALRGDILAGGEGCWDTALVMSSFRIDQAGRLIFGGIGNLEGLGGKIHDGWAHRKLRKLFAQFDRPQFDFAWRGQIAMTRDHIPKILEFGPNAYACFGYSGRGIGPGTVFGTEVARALLGNDASGLPVTPRPEYGERFKGLRAAYYEIGATLTHATRCHNTAR